MLVLPGMQERILRSGPGGQDYMIFTYATAAETPPGGFPVAYVLDANVVFLTLAQQAAVQTIWRSSTRVAPMLLVGVGYPIDHFFDGARRAFDYTPPAQGGVPQAYYHQMKTEMGGADRFLDFIERDLKPLIAGEFKVDPEKQALIGHSFGGLFALHALFTRPESFQTYVSLSPALRWGLPAIRVAEDSFLRQSPSGLLLRLLMAFGEYEQKLRPEETDRSDLAFIESYRREHRMRDEVLELAARLAAAGRTDLQVTVEEYPDTDHMSLVPTALSRVLRFVSAM